MAKGRATQKPPGRRGILPPKRPTVTAVGTDDLDDDGDAGSAGVREPRRPLPPGPLSAAAELPPPEPPTYLRLADARQ
jgi:hypothetical protein